MLFEPWMLELTVSVVLPYQLLHSLQVQEQQSPPVASKNLPQGHSPGLGNLLPLTFPSNTLQFLCAFKQAALAPLPPSGILCNGDTVPCVVMSGK